MTSHQYIQQLTANMIPSLRYNYNEDFSLWQSEARKKLTELLGLPLIKPHDDCFAIEKTDIKNGLSYTYFSFQSEDSYTVTACLVKQADNTKKTPLCVCLQGHSSGMHISLGEPKYEGDSKLIAGGRDFAIQAAKEGMTAIAIEQRYMGAMGFGDRPQPSCSAGFESDANQALSALLIGRTAIGERVWDIMCTIDIVIKYFSDIVDTDNIICMGNSGGGTATFYASCLDSRITLSVPSCSVCTFESSIMSMNHCPCNFIPNIRKYFDMGDLGALIAPNKLLVVCGDTDNIFPLAGVKEAFNLIFKHYQHIKKGDYCELLIGHGGHQFYPHEAWPAIQRLLKL